MKKSKIIYADGVVETMSFHTTQQAYDYARQQARQRGTYVRSQSVVTDSLIGSAVEREGCSK